MAENVKSMTPNTNSNTEAKDTKARGLALAGEGGGTVIDSGVIAKIAGVAIREVDGVHKLAAYGTGQAIENLARSLGRRPFRSLGVNVEVGQVECAVDCRIVVTYGYAIPKLAAAVRKNVASRLTEMTGLTVKEVNIEVVDLYFEGGEDNEATEVPAEEAPARRVR